MNSDKVIIKGMQQEHDRLIEMGREVLDQRDAAKLELAVSRRQGGNARRAIRRGRRERDGYKALAKVRGEALEADKEDFEHDLDCGECARLRDENTDWLAYPSCDEGLRLGHRALDLREPAIAMTPEEARKRKTT